MSKNPKRGQRIIKSARQRKHAFSKTMTSKQRREYEEEKKRRKNGMYMSTYRLSMKENIIVTLVAILFTAAFCGIFYLLYLSLKFIVRGLPSL